MITSADDKFAVQTIALGLRREHHDCFALRQLGLLAVPDAGRAILEITAMFDDRYCVRFLLGQSGVIARSRSCSRKSCAGAQTQKRDVCRQIGRSV
jgi:hypothetical protein